MAPDPGFFANFLDYGVAGLLALTLVVWFIERRETMMRFERLMEKSADADIQVATALESFKASNDAVREDLRLIVKESR